MSRNLRIALVVAALVVAVAAFFIAQPGDDEEDGGGASTTPARTQAEPTPEQAPTATEPPPEVTRIRLRGGVVAGGPKTIEAEAGETVRIAVSADGPDEIHLHGYDITREAAPGRPARFRFTADAEGEFVLESHVAEDAGRDPLIARLLVGPS